MGQVYGKKIGKDLSVVHSDTRKTESLESYAAKNEKALNGAANTRESA